LITPDAFWSMAINMTDRRDWDAERCNGLTSLMAPKNQTDEQKKFSADNNEEYWYFIGKKPPIPAVQTRDFMVRTWCDEKSLGEGKRAFIWTSCEHETKLADQENVLRMEIHVIATIVEKSDDGDGCKVTEYRAVDAKGTMPDMAVDQGTKMGPKKNFTAWINQINKLNQDKSKKAK